MNISDLPSILPGIENHGFLSQAWFETFANHIIDFAILSVIFLLLGLLLAYLMFGRARDRLKKAREENVTLTGKLNEIIEDQNVLLDSLNKKFGLEQKRWHQAMANKEIQLEDLNNKLAMLDSGAAEYKDHIRNLELELSEKTREVELLEESHTSYGARLNELESTLQERDGRLQDLENRLGESNNLLEQRAREVENLHFEKEEQERALQELLSENQKHSTERSAELERLIREKDEELEHLRTSQQLKIVELEDLLGERESTIVGLQSDLSENDRLRDQQGRIRELEDELARIKREFAIRGDVLAKKEEQLHEAKSRINDSTTSMEKLSELEWRLGERDAELEELKTSTESASRRIEELEYLLWEKDGQLESVKNENEELKRTLDSNGASDRKTGELEWLLGEKNAELDQLNQQLRAKDALVSRVEELERSLREREGELERWWTENEHLKKQLREAELKVDAIRLEKGPHPGKVEELERTIRERDAEMNRLRFEKEQLYHQLQEKQGERQRFDRFHPDDLYFRVRELERQLDGKTDPSLASRIHAPPFSSIEQRVLDLERMLDKREREMRNIRTEQESQGDKLEATLGQLGESDLETRIRELEWLVNEKPGNHSPEDLRSRIRELEKSLDRKPKPDSA